MLLSFVSSCKLVTKDHSIPEKPDPEIPESRLFVLTQPYATHPLFLDNPAVGTFFRQSPFRRFRQIIQPGFEVDAFDEMFEMEIV
jgi:hypothetical protein